MLTGRGLSRTDQPTIGLQIAFLISYPLWTLSFLGLFTAFASRRWNHSTLLGRELASNSYYMYLVHYVFVMILPLLLSGWPQGPVLLKFVIVALSTVVLSFLLSKFVINKFPRLVVVGLFGVNIMLAIITII